MTIKGVLKAMDREEFFLDELLDALQDKDFTEDDRKWYARTLLDTLSDEELKAEIKFRENVGSTDPFYP